jgi:hypothetical protein
MGKITTRLWLLIIAMLGLCGLGSMSAALASPPISQKGARHLDLRPATAVVGAEEPSAVFPSALHRATLSTREQIQFPGMGTEGPQKRIPSRAEEFVRRVHREGLPVARLWENKSALVSLGLNQKGKPGLWIIQKVR